MAFDYDEQELDEIMNEDISSGSGSEDLDFDPDDIEESPREVRRKSTRAHNRRSLK